jgi:hypothetical protein
MGLGKGRAAGPAHAYEEQNENPECGAGQEYHNAENSDDGKRGDHWITLVMLLFARLAG